MTRLFIFIIFSIWLSLKSAAQHYSLQQCIDTALANYIPVKQSGLLVEDAEVAWRQSKANFLPYLNTDIFHGLYQGRSIDPSTNSYATQNLNSASYQLNAGITIFNGGSLSNDVKQRASALEASRMEWQQSKDNLVLNVILAYLQVLNSEDIVTSVKRQADISGKQLERLNILNSQGAVKPSDVTDLQGQLLNDQLSLAAAGNTLENAKISLGRLLTHPYEKQMTLERMPVGEFLEPYPLSAEEVYQQSLAQFSQVKAVALRTKSYAYAVRALRGGLYPAITLGGGLNTNYSSIAQNTGGKIPYNMQLGNNISSSLGVGISIPVFNRFQTRNRIKIAGIALKNSMLEEADTHTELRQQIDQVYVNMSTAFERYKLLAEQAAAYTASFKAAEVRYNAGVGTSIDLLVSKDRLDRTNINLISAKYDFLLRKKVLDYYISNMPSK